MTQARIGYPLDPVKVDKLHFLSKSVDFQPVWGSADVDAYEKMEGGTVIVHPVAPSQRLPAAQAFLEWPQALLPCKVMLDWAIKIG